VKRAAVLQVFDSVRVNVHAGTLRMAAEERTATNANVNDWTRPIAAHQVDALFGQRSAHGCFIHVAVMLPVAAIVGDRLNVVQGANP
jgi:hypothetical protein